MTLSLGSRIAAVATALVVLLVGAVAAFQERQLSSGFSALLHQQQETLAQAVADDLDYKLGMHLSVLGRAARTANAATFANPAAQQPFLAASELRPLFDGIALVGIDGTVLVTDPPQAMLLNIADRDYFQRALATGEPAISRPLMTRSNQQPAVLMAVPVKDPSGRIVGLLGAGLSLLKPNMLGKFSEARIGTTGYYTVATRDSQPVYVMHPDPARLLAPASATGDTDGDVIARKSIRNVDWELRAVLPAAEAYAPLHQARRQLMGQMLLLAIVVGTAVWLAVQRLLHPLGTLRATMQRLRTDPLAPVALDLRAGDERGDLAREFDALIRESRAQRAELAAVMDASPLGQFRAGLDGRLTYVNEQYLRINGLAREEAAEGWLTLMREDVREQMRDEWRAIVAQPVPYQAVRRLQRRDGSEATVQLRSAPVVVDGQVVGHVGTLADITDRVRAEKSQRMLTAVFDATTDFVVQHDPVGCITYMNPAARRRVGLALDASLAGLSFKDFNPPAMVQRIEREIVPAALAHGVWLGDAVAWDADRQEVPLSEMVIAHRDRNGRLEHFSVVMRDVSAEKSADAERQRAAQALHSLADAMPAVVAVVDAHERYRFVNAEFARWHGATPESIVGRSVREVLGEREYRRSQPHIERALAGERVAFEKDYLTNSGELHQDVSFIPLQRPDGSSDGFVCIALDITQRKVEALRLREASQTDPLTGLLNRAGFDERLRQCAQRLAHDGLAALLYIDLDHFKPVNDCHGHAVGDEVLRQFAHRLRNLVRPTDAIARIGGDEFAILLQGLREAANADAVAAKVVDAAATAFSIDGRTVAVSASVGIAAWRSTEDPDWRNVMLRADAMLYRAKESGRGRHAGPSDLAH